MENKEEKQQKGALVHVFKFGSGLVVLFGGGEEKFWIGHEIQVLFRWVKIHQISLIV